MTTTEPLQADAVFDRIRAAVADLASGCTGEADVAAKLLKEGHRGSRCVGDSCPVAKALAERLGESVEVDPGYAYVADDDEYLVHVLLPSFVSDFIEGFDMGRHPELEVGAS